MTYNNKVATGKAALLAATVSCLALAAPAYAQEQEGTGGSVEALQSDIIVTATKRGDQKAQNVPIAITALGSDQLQALNFQNLQSLTYTIPNVQFEDVGTTKGTANFSIRGLGINSSIPSIDPTVGVFVDGVYLGITSGVLLDNFDLEAVEVLRGPQGILFGRNVTGGAVLIRTKLPGNTFKADFRAGIESGVRWTVDGSVSGPISDTLAAKVAVYHSDDSGWFTNKFDGSSYGASRQTIARGALVWRPSSASEFILRYEHGEIDGDGPPAQNHALFSRQSFDLSLNERGYTHQNWDSASLETNLDVSLGNGKVTGIFAWRRYFGDALSDIDATPNTAFHAGLLTDQDQFSSELRYAGTFGNLNVTTGLYYFRQNLLYVESRLLDTNVADANPPIFRVGGGQGRFSTMGAFAALDWRVTDALTLSAGVRYTYEEKNGNISRIRRAADPLGGPGLDVPGEGLIGGDPVARTLNFTDTNLRPRWNDWSPKVGLQWKPVDDVMVYASWAKGFRSGGFNFRDTALGVTPAPFDSENQDSFELGLKSDLFDRRLRLNLALFRNKIHNIQREESFPDPISGVQQIIQNAGDATIQGFEVEGRFSLTPTLLLSVQAGYTHGKYDKIVIDINGNGLVGDPADYALKLPRLSPWTYGASLIHDLPLGSLGKLSSRVSYNHRDAAFYTDNNLGFLNAVDTLDANLTFRPAKGSWSLSVYGSNLTNQVSFGNDTLLPNIAAFGGNGGVPRPTFSPLSRGRVIGAEIRVSLF